MVFIGVHWDLGFDTVIHVHVMLLPTSAFFVALSSLEEVARSLAHVRAAEAATRRRRRSRSVGQTLPRETAAVSTKT